MPELDRKGMLGVVQSYWNAAYRGFVPGGLNNVPPVADDIGPDPVPFDQDEESFIEADADVKIAQPIAPVPVIITDDLSHTIKRVEKYLIASTENVPIIGANSIAPRDPFRTQLILQNIGPGVVVLGQDESIGTAGYQLAVNAVLVLGTTREVWAQQLPSATQIAQICVIQEYDKDTFTS